MPNVITAIGIDLVLYRLYDKDKFMGIIEWLNTNNGAVIGIATVLLVGITGYYAYLTWRMLKANNTPEIEISLRLHEAYTHCVILCIENIGTGEARNIQFQTDLSFKPDDERSLDEVGFLRNGINYLGPGKKKEHFLVSVIGKLNDLKNTPLKIGVTYMDSVEKVYERAFHLDFEENQGLATIGRPPLFEIAESTKTMKEELRNFTTGFHKPTILTESASEHRTRQRANALESRIEQLPNEVQEEILQEFAVAVTKREKEVQDKEQNAETTSDENSL